MPDLLWLIPALPLAGFVILALLGGRMSRAAAAVVGAGAVGGALVVTAVSVWSFITAPPDGHAVTQTLWTWIHVGGFAPTVSLRLDALSAVMISVVTFVGFLIMVYSSEYMAGDEGFSRYFAYMNLFVAAMLILVLADNLLLLYLGWEGVGVCSYLLIGFWYKDPANGRAARKAFIVTRVGDTAFILGLFLLFHELGTLNIQELMTRSAAAWGGAVLNQPMAVAATLLLLGGALGKSAQLPLQTWLPDAMAGPTPVSALIHAATMVTAGVYLIARTHVLFALAPQVQLLVAAIGAATLLVAGFAALTQSDFKRVLAYSTISQIGYMFLALGVGAWSAGIFHFMTHAFFKSLLFLGAGSVILALHHEQDMFKMGGLWRRMPVTFWTFLIGSASLAALPLVTAGAYSKDLILYQVWLEGSGGAESVVGGSTIQLPWLWLVGIVGALTTSIYTFRMVFVVFFGRTQTEPTRRTGPAMAIPLVILAALSVAGGWIELPRTLGGVPVFSNFLRSVFPMTGPEEGAVGTEVFLEILMAVVALSGVVVAWLFYLRRPDFAAAVARNPAGRVLHDFWLGGCGFDWVYDRLFVRPFVWAARVNRGDFIDAFYRLLAALSRFGNLVLRQTETGNVRWYAAGMVIGAIITVTILVLL